MTERHRSLYDFHEWLFEQHCQHLFPFDRHMTPAELDYLLRCAELAEEYEQDDPPPDRPDLSYFSYSHRVLGDQVNSSRVAYGSIGAPELAFEAARPVLAERRIDVPKLLPVDRGLVFYGLGWDISANGFKLYYRVPEIDILKSVRPAMFESAPPKYLSEGLWACGLLGDKVVEEKIYFYPADEPPGDPLAVGSHGRAIVTSDQRITFSQYDVEDPAIWYDRVNGVAQSIMELYDSEDCALDTIAYIDRDNCTLYFPRATIYFEDDEG